MSSRDARMKSLQDACFLDTLIKMHLQEPGKCTELWKTDDIEDVVEHFNKLVKMVTERVRAQQGASCSHEEAVRLLAAAYASDGVTAVQEAILVNHNAMLLAKAAGKPRVKVVVPDFEAAGSWVTHRDETFLTTSRQSWPASRTPC